MENNEKNQEIKTVSEDGFVINEEEGMKVPEPEKKAEKESMAKELFEWLDVLVTAVIAVVLIFSIFFRVATIDGPSMMNTLLHGEKVIISGLAYEPKVGDVVVISRNLENSVESQKQSELPIIKRIIAVGGDTVDIDFERGIVIVNGVELDEPYTRTLTQRKHDVEFPLVVKEGYVFVLGDNRQDSLDSRSSRIGLIDERYILGRAMIRVFPFNKFGGF